MSFSRAKRFPDSGSPLEKKSNHSRCSDNDNIVNFGDGGNYRRRSCSMSTKAINNHEDGRKSRYRKFSNKGASLNQSFSGFSNIESKIKEEKAPEDRKVVGEDIYIWDYYKNVIADLRIKNMEFQPVLKDTNVCDTNTCKIGINEILSQAEKVLNGSRQQLKKVISERMNMYRKEAERKIKEFVKDMDRSHQVFLDEVQNEYDKIAEDLQEDLNEVCRYVEKKTEKRVNTDSISCEPFKGCQRYINFLESRFIEILKAAENKVAERNQVIDILKTELDAQVLEEKLQKTLLKQTQTRRGSRRFH